MGDAAVHAAVGVRAVQREGVEVGECGWVVRRLFITKNKQKNGEVMPTGLCCSEEMVRYTYLRAGLGGYGRLRQGL